MNLGMVSYVYGGVEMLPNTIPLPNFWRTPTNNDSGNMMPQRYAQWKIASMYVTTRQNQRFADTSPRVEKMITISPSHTLISCLPHRRAHAR